MLDFLTVMAVLATFRIVYMYLPKTDLKKVMYRK